MINLAKYAHDWIPVKYIDSADKRFQFRLILAAKEMAESMKADGQKLPIILWKRLDGRLQVVCGFTRLEAAKRLEWEKVLVVVIPEQDMDEKEALRLRFIENVNRKPYTEPELFQICGDFKKDGKNNMQIADIIGIDERSVRRYLMVLDMAPEIQADFMNGWISLREVEELSTGKTARRAPSSESVDNSDNADEARRTLAYLKRKVKDIRELPEFKEEYKSYINTRAGQSDTDIAKSYKNQSKMMSIQPLKDGGLQVNAKFQPDKGKLEDFAGFLVKTGSDLLKFAGETQAGKDLSAEPEAIAKVNSESKAQPNFTNQDISGYVSRLSAVTQKLSEFSSEELEHPQISRIKLSVDTDRVDDIPIPRIKLGASENKAVFVHGFVLGHWHKLLNDVKIQWTAPQGVEIEAKGSTAKIRLAWPISEIAMITASLILDNGKKAEAHIEVEGAE